MTVDLKRLEGRVIEIEGALGVMGVAVPQNVMPLTSCETWARQYAWPVGSVMTMATNAAPNFGTWSKIGEENIDAQVTVYFYKRIS